MSFNFSVNRKFNIFEKNEIDKNNISNYQKQQFWNLDLFLTAYCFTMEEIDEIERKAFHKKDNNFLWLYDFEMNWIQYEEYISEIISSNGNYSEYFVNYKEKNNNEGITKKMTYINQYWECPKCRESHFYETYQNWKNLEIATCLNCNYTWSLKEFDFDYDEEDKDNDND